jgi:mono/diheme cytochrome c family protein
MKQLQLFAFLASWREHPECSEMIATNLKIMGIVLGTILFYTFLANTIPQVESAVPEELALGADFTVEDLVAAGEQLYFGAGGCVACHGTGARAPNLLVAEAGGSIGARCGERVPGMSCKDYLYRALIDPNAYVVEGYQPIMPDMSRILSEPQLWALVAFMESQGGEVTVTPEDVQAATPAPNGQTAATAAAAPTQAVASGTLDPMTLLREHQCLVCHQLGDEGGPIGPPLTGIGARRDAAFLRRAILDPNAETTPGYEAMAGTMPTNFGEQMTAAQLEAMVQFLAEQR